MYLQNSYKQITSRLLTNDTLTAIKARSAEGSGFSAVGFDSPVPKEMKDQAAHRTDAAQPGWTR
ncbi:MAG: hypothetical protein HUJ54_12495 [Erysipelotrichaceae bacterium]|nr:hypothetical protein [Erysipelotrichaceae bacterium]